MAKALALPKTYREWSQGVDLKDAASAAGGLAASTMIPGLIIKDTSTTTKKIIKLVVSLGCALGAGSVAKSLISSEAGKAAVIGGVAGVVAQGLAMFTKIQIGRTSGRMGAASIVLPSSGRSSETVSMIEP